jgi:cytochrome c2
VRARRVPVSIAVALAVGAGSLLGVIATRANAEHGAVPHTSHVAAVLAARGGSSGKGTFTGNLSATGSTGTLAWTLTVSNLSGPVTATEIASTATGPPLVRLCGPCPAHTHRSTTLHGKALAAVVKSKGWVRVRTAMHSTGELAGKLKGSPSAGGGGGGGGLVVTPTPALVAQGKGLADKFSCTGCHTIDGSKSEGPTWKGLAGSKVHQTDGTTVTATDSYLVGVITDPSTLKVEGYDPGVMTEAIPPGLVSTSQAKALVAYIKTLK